MDKFGILKLLNSFYDFYGKNLQGNSTVKQAENSEKTNDVKSDFSKKEHAAPTPPHPLQSGMVSTMKSHDEFVKRVMQKQNKK